jgi:ParB family chromosome partitioning protein
MTEQSQAIYESFDIIDVPLNKLKKSLRNARRTPHGEADIEALAASIAVKGVLQAPVVEPELDEAGAATGFYLTTIGEGRRLALLLLAKRKVVKKTEPVRCVVDLTNDPHEISLDENVTRSAMHPADQFEAFRRLAEERGLGAEDIGARFGVSAQVVRQRLRLGAVSPRLMDFYRAGELSLDQMMAFAVSEDHARQEQVLELLGGHRPPYLIRRTMTEAKVPATDRRAVFIGAEAYGEAGGTILRDLFTEDGGGWFEDVALLDRLACEQLEGIAETLRGHEGWRWAEAHIDYGLGADPFDAHDNITAGAAWLKELHDRYGSPGFLAAYNAGPARYADHLTTGRPLPPETQAYVAQLNPVVSGNAAADPLAWTRAGLFPGASDGSAAVGESAAVEPPHADTTALFTLLSGRGPRP